MRHGSAPLKIMGKVVTGSSKCKVDDDNYQTNVPFPFSAEHGAFDSHPQASGSPLPGMDVFLQYRPHVLDSVQVRTLGSPKLGITVLLGHHCAPKTQSFLKNYY